MNQKKFYGRTFKRTHRLLAFFLIVLSGLTPIIGYAAISFNGMTYSQNFNSLASSGTSIVWTNDSTLSGWFLFRQPAPGTALTTYMAGTGSGTIATGKFYSFGLTASTDRALGGIGSGGIYFDSPASGDIAGWIAFSAINTTGSTIDSLNVTFNGEQWRDAVSTPAQTMVLEYGFGTTFNTVSTWTAPGGTFDWTSPVATVNPVDGNVAGLVSGRGGFLNNLNWANGNTLWIRWVERNDLGFDHGLAIDDFSLGPIGQTIAFGTLMAKTFGDTDFTMSATGGASGNPVNFTSATTGICTVSGTTVHLIGAGICTINADQAGNSSYSAATQISQSFTVNKVNQTIAFTPPASLLLNNGTYTLIATGGASGNTVIFTSSPSDVCTTGGVNGSTLTLINSGNCTLTADQAGNANYNAALQVSQNVSIIATPTIYYNLSVQIAGTGNGSITGAGDGSYPAGTAIILTATPDANSIFTGWSTGCSDKMTLMADTVCIATFVAKTVTPPVVQPQPTIPKTRDLYVYLGGDGQGHITSQPAGIDCHADGRNCVHTYDTGTYVKLTATAAPGSKFWAWGGNDDCEDGQVSLYGNRYCTAYFHLLEQSLTVTQSGTGYGTVKTQPAGIDCGTTCQAKFSPNTLVYLVATPAFGSKFVGYNGDEECGGGVVKLEKAKTCNAIFEVLPPPSQNEGDTVSSVPVTYTLNLSIQGQGHVVSTPVGFDCGVVCTASFASGTHVNLTAQSEEGSIFTHFSGDVGCADGHFNLENHQTCVAHFAVPILPPVTELSMGVAAFVLSNYEIREGAGVLNVTVKRVGGSDGILMVNYATVDGPIAKSGLDFVGAQGALVWDDGDMADKTIVVTVLGHKELSEETFYLVLTNAQGELIDTAIISLLHEVVTPPPVIMPAPAAVSTPVVEDHCPPEVKLEASCDANFQTIGTLEVTERGYLANAIIEGDLTNQGWVANLHVKSTATVTGGTITGYLENEGLISDFQFRGRAIVGGTLGGVIHNTSVVGGYFQDVYLAANTQITGGLLTGEIIGDCAAPAVLDNVRILRGSHLVCVALGKRVVLEENVRVDDAD
ncbi:MAG: hypothetical protein BWK79_06860 [Beggiatoa sp. IS2]|nr:MAG: hypothetical protein BWK79_06860 [Beggiatoa sp. IS2]